MSQKEAPREELSSEELNALIIDSIQDIKGQNILKLDLRHLEEAPADFFIICEGQSNTQVKAISDNIYKRLKQEGNTLPAHIEGQQNALWILVDYFSTVVHVFYHETRVFYELEDMWSDAIFTAYTDL
ncbi:MAG TPA: ribosome silencing factor [Saprospiraceae bacterium]|nr:ribosome silencing factor [Saprospiraceae bacterium]